MFFQRKKKRLLRELWRSRLPKPPSLPLSDYYGPCSPSTGATRVPAPAFWTADESNGRQRCCEATTKEQRVVMMRRGSRSGFCLVGNCCGGDAQSTCSSMSVDSGSSNQIYADEESEEKAFLAFLGKALAQRQLETLLESVVRGAGSSTSSACVLIRRQEAMNWSEDLPVIACRMWRWTDLDTRTDLLKRVPSCPNGQDPVYICCNPGHWFRVLQPELPPPPYSAALEQAPSPTPDYGRQRRRRRLNNSSSPVMDLQEENSDEKKGHPANGDDVVDLDELPEYRDCRGGAPDQRQQHFGRADVDSSATTMMMMPPEESSWSTHGQDKSTAEWCSLAYWEQSVRVGAVVKVDRATVNVVSGHPVNDDDVCLASLATAMPKLAANSTRAKIGAGITVSHEGDSMWLYNRSTAPIFVHSLTICDVDSYLGNSSMIMKLYPGYCMRAYNPRARMDRYRAMTEEMALGPVDVHSVRISFLKGWGQTYKRQDIKSCPCWMEVILNPCHFEGAGEEEVGS